MAKYRARMIEPPVCIAMFALALALGSIEGAYFVLALYLGAWLLASLHLVLLLVNGVTAGAQVWFIARHVGRTSYERIVVEIRISDASGDGERTTDRDGDARRIH